MTIYLTLAEVLAIHEDQIARYGGSYGLRDRGLLEAAINRPRNGYYDGLLPQAAALWESLAQNHCFVDGNKRTSFAVMYTFLRVNGVDITAEADSILGFITERYETGTFKFDELRAWLAENTAPL